MVLSTMAALLQIYGLKASIVIFSEGSLFGLGLLRFTSLVGTQHLSPHFLSAMEQIGGIADSWRQ
tara:strand:+ start:302 stop:496 length:195 start_codon:yes stop_codon:yes gene_type:complete